MPQNQPDAKEPEPDPIGLERVLDPNFLEYIDESLYNEAKKQRIQQSEEIENNNKGQKSPQNRSNEKGRKAKAADIQEDKKFGMPDGKEIAKKQNEVINKKSWEAVYRILGRSYYKNKRLFFGNINGHKNSLKKLVPPETLDRYYDLIRAFESYKKDMGECKYVVYQKLSHRMKHFANSSLRQYSEELKEKGIELDFDRPIALFETISERYSLKRLKEIVEKRIDVRDVDGPDELLNSIKRSLDLIKTKYVDSFLLVLLDKYGVTDETVRKYVIRMCRLLRAYKERGEFKKSEQTDRKSVV